MGTMSANPARIAAQGRELVRAEVALRGWAVREVVVGRRPTLLIERGVTRRRVRVSTRRRGMWQASIRDAQSSASPELRTRLWIFVDLQGESPEFYIAPESWMAKDIDRHHRAYLAKHGGQRKRSPASTHHSITLDRLAPWHNRWDLLEGPMS